LVIGAKRRRRLRAGVLLLRLLAGFPELLDEEEARLAVDHALKAAVFVASHDDEPLTFPADSLVLRASEQQSLEARLLAALAQKLGLAFDLELLVHLRVLLVDLAKKPFVADVPFLLAVQEMLQD
jgi:hypothetical protein